MSKDSSELDKLKRLYETLGSSGAFLGVNNLHRQAKKEGILLSRKEVENFLLTQPSYTKYRRIKKRFVRNKVIVPGLNFLWDVDTHFLYTYNKYNCFFLIIDCFSRKAYVRSAKNKKSTTSAQKLQEVIEQVGMVPRYLRSDLGSEYLGTDMQNLLQKLNITHIPARGRLKASFSELFGRIMKERFMKYREKTHDRNWVKALPLICESMNKKYLASIGMSPNEVTVENQNEVYQRLYKGMVSTKSTDKQQIPVGSPVRVVLLKSEGLSKGYSQSHTTEIFYVAKKRSKYPRTKYFLTDQSGNSLDRSFYFEELQPVISI